MPLRVQGNLSAAENSWLPVLRLHYSGLSGLPIYHVLAAENEKVRSKK